MEETVTSPEELPEPFPAEEKQPDVAVLHQVGEHYWFVHHAYRDDETERWRIETLRENPAIVTDAGSFPEALEIPPEVRFDSAAERPVDPGFALELCLKPECAEGATLPLCYVVPCRPKRRVGQEWTGYRKSSRQSFFGVS